ncbi:MAG: DUF937 domain-containing protein [Ornithinibacter sp.]
MSAYDEILGALPVDQVAQQVGSSPEEVKTAAAALLPALMGGLDANTRQGGASSLLEALGQHDPSLVQGGADLSSIDASDGTAIASHIFGDQQDAVAERLGASPLSGQGVSSSLIKKLIPIIAPMVLSWLAGRVMGGRTGAGGAAPGGAAPGGAASGGGLENVLQDVLGSVTGGGSAGRAPTSGGIDAGSIISDVLGGMLGGGRR